MTLPDASHPVWNLIRLAVVGVVLVMLLKFNYNGLDPRDVLTVFLTLAGLGGFDVLKKFSAPRKEGDQ
jgi:hypothetical protein